MSAMKPNRLSGEATPNDASSPSQQAGWRQPTRKRLPFWVFLLGAFVLIAVFIGTMVFLAELPVAH
jgi:type VI protein secretion system component VasF